MQFILLEESIKVAPRPYCRRAHRNLDERFDRVIPQIRV